MLLNKNEHIILLPITINTPVKTAVKENGPTPPKKSGSRMQLLCDIIRDLALRGENGFQMPDGLKGFKAFPRGK